MSREKIPVLLMARSLHIGGSERQMTETAKRLDRSDFEVHVGCFQPAGIFGEELKDFGVNVVQWPVTSYRSAGAVRGARDLVRYIRVRGIRIVHAWDYPLNVYAIPIARLATRACAIASQRSERALIPSGYRLLMPVVDRLAHAIVVNCRFLERQLTAQGVPATKLRLCYNGIDLERFRRETIPHPLTVGVVCALRPEKALPTLIDAFAVARDVVPDLRLLVVGDGPELGALQRQAAEAGIAGSCHFEPAVSDVTHWLSQIDIFVLPSRSEAFSNSLMEAMACGCCVLASDTGGNPELVRPGETGFLFPPGDVQALAGLLRKVGMDAALRTRLALGAMQAVHSGFSAAAAGRRMQETYRDLIDRRKQT